MKEFEQSIGVYSIAVEMADRLSARRGSTNNFYITLESVFLTSLGLLAGNSNGLSTRLAIALIAVSLILASLWWLQISSYRRLNKAKYLVIHELEQSLKQKPFTREWEILQSNSFPHLDLSQIERVVPLFILFIQAILVIGALK